MATNKMAATQVQTQERSRNDNTTVFHASGFLAKWPIIGTVMFLFGILMFSGLAYNLAVDGPLIKWDVLLANTLPPIGLKSPPFVKGLMVAGFYIGDYVIIVLGLLLGLYLLLKRQWQELTMLAIGMAGSTFLFLSISNIIDRARPPTQIWNSLKIPGFPSGHAVAVVVFYGLVAYLIAPNLKSIFWKVIVVATAVFIMLFVGFSRVFTAGHYLTDVLAGYAIGIAWSGMDYTLIEIYFQKRRNQNVKKR